MAIQTVRGVVRIIASQAHQRVQFTVELPSAQLLRVLMKRPPVPLVVGAEVAIRVMGPVQDGTTSCAGLSVE